jgi:adenylate cyclase
VAVSTATRQLAAIMFTDIVGYTTLMGLDEVKALDVLRKSRGIQKQAVEGHGGKWLKEMGDGVLAQFNSALEAVQCGIEIQKKAQAELQAMIRIGINLGDVTIENDDVFGDGVNIASRLQAISDPGGIYISESVHDALGARSDIKCEYLCAVQLKNVDHPIKTYYVSGDGLPTPTRDKINKLSTPASPRRKILTSPTGIIIVVIILATAFLTRGWWLPVAGNKGFRIAVLPVADLSGSENGKFMVEGIQSALITEIGTVGALQVISRTSSSRYRDEEKTIPEIARELNIDMVVESELIRMDDSVQLQCRLIQAFPAEQQLWSKVYGEATKNVLRVYDNVALEISRAIDIELTPQEQTQLAGTAEVNPEAYRAYLKSQYYYNIFTRESFALGLESLDLALQYDPNYFQAYMGIAQLWTGMAEMGIVPWAETYPKVRAAEEKVLAFHIENSEFYSMEGSIHAYVEWHWKQGIMELEKAIKLNPNDSKTRMNYSYLLAIMEYHDEARKQMDIALELDPFNSFIESLYSWNMLYARRYEESIEHCKKSLNLAPKMWVARDALRQAYYLLGRLDESFATTKSLYTDQGMTAVAEALDLGYKDGGYQKAMALGAEALVEYSRTNFVSPESIAETYAYAGKYDEALTWLEKAYDAHDQELHYLSVVPIYDGLRDRPRFQELVKKVNVPKKKDGLLGPDSAITTGSGFASMLIAENKF